MTSAQCRAWSAATRVATAVHAASEALLMNSVREVLRKKNLEDMHAWLRYWARLAIFTQSKKKDGQ